MCPNGSQLKMDYFTMDSSERAWHVYCPFSSEQASYRNPAQEPRQAVYLQGPIITTYCPATLHWKHLLKEMSSSRTGEADLGK